MASFMLLLLLRLCGVAVKCFKGLADQPSKV
eukprot:CAMPEP_0171780788 /NCGR_PEP_ID=MMETSP0991-20121206/59832_1 /TAXON_ID=483369 /ORGANISM="non described non described, Strain CCMP2098" /LENGTH=30 /DNA_ID= /DNA_START= /DNA_END= /DNA_ORIENTATION=